MTSSRASRSSTKVCLVAGRMERTRMVASVTAEIFAVTTALSTTRCRRPQDAGRADVLDRLEIEVLHDCPRLTCHERRMIPFDDHFAIAEDPVREPRRRLVEKDKIDAAVDCRLESA